MLQQTAYFVYDVIGKYRKDPCLYIRGNFFTIKKVLESKAFHRCFKLGPNSMTPNEEKSGKDTWAGKAAPISGDEGESYHF